jgi:hypothetical protein
MKETGLGAGDSGLADDTPVVRAFRPAMTEAV